MAGGNISTRDKQSSRVRLRIPNRPNGPPEMALSPPPRSRHRNLTNEIGIRADNIYLNQQSPLHKKETSPE